MRLFRNCKIVTMNESMPEADVILVEQGKIIYIGMEKDCPSEYSNTACLNNIEIIDLAGATVVPGFWESHLHLVDGMRSITELNLRDCSSFESFKYKLQEYAEKSQATNWIIGHGWDENRIFNGEFPDRHLIDSVCSTTPVILIRMDGHSLCTNSAAIDELELFKLPSSSEVPCENGPTGMFYENTANMIVEKVVEKLSDGYIEKLVLKAQDLFLQNGITSINDICTKYGRYFDIYRRLQMEGRLKLRITSSPYGMSETSMAEFDERIGEETDRLRIGSPKYFIDGSFGSRTALLFEEYSDDAGNKGLQIIEKEDLMSIIMDNEVVNRPVNIHAIGDKAVNIILNCVEAARLDNKRDIRSRIEHIQIIKHEDIERFKLLDITASFQPVFLYEEELTKSRLGQGRLKEVYRFKSFIESGANVVFNSDWPYGGGDMPEKPQGDIYIGFEPLLGIHAACCKQMNLSETVSAYQALKCYTNNAAFANYREKELGMLKKGFWGDFVVLSKDIICCNPEEIINTEVLMTVINGEIAYKKNK